MDKLDYEYMAEIQRMLETVLGYLDTLPPWCDRGCDIVAMRTRCHEILERAPR